MFARRRRTSKTSESTSEVPASFVTWQKLLATLPALATMGFLIWPRYGTPELIKFEPLDNISTISITSTQTNLLTVETTTVRKNFGSSLDQRSTYCQITACTSVSCSIPKTIDAANVATEFIETVFKAECKNTDSVKLSLKNCKFSANKLRKNWLRTNLSIEELILDSCSLSEIEDGAFDQFEDTKTLTLINNKFTSLRKVVFHPLTSLQELNIRENFIKQIEFNLLENAANSLNTLDLSGVIGDPLVLQNITGGRVLKKLQTLSLRENFISEITDESFQGTPNVKSLYLTNSGIDSLSQRSLEPMASIIEQLFINGNRISSLPKGLFDSALQGQKSFHVTLDNNPWNCDCRLQWMQDFINAHANVVTNIPVCSSPPENANKSFITAKFCLSNSTTNPVTKSTTAQSTLQTTTEQTKTETTTAIEPEKIAVTCSISDFSGSGSLRKLLSTNLQFSSRIPGFFVHSVTDKSILLMLPNLEKGLTLLWFNGSNVKRSISCVKHVRHFYQVQNIDPETTYTICVLNDNEDTVSPLNCLAAMTSSASSRTWLKNKAHIIILVTLVVLAVFFIAIFSTFLVIRKYPSLLRGSKRVMLVKKNLVDAIVLPRGVNLEEKRKRRESVARRSNRLEDGYIIPLPPAPVPPPRVSRISRVSVQSDWHSYVSEVDPTEAQLTSWGLARLNSDLEDQDDAPPLPPYPLNNIPSLSLSVEVKAEDAEYVMSAV